MNASSPPAAPTATSPSSVPAVTPDGEAALPLVALIGDSIRMGYAPLVAERLRGKARVYSPALNGGDTANVLSKLDEGIFQHQPDVVHLNCGLHDLRLIRPEAAGGASGAAAGAEGAGGAIAAAGAGGATGATTGSPADGAASRLYQVPIEDYRAHLKEIVARIRANSQASLVFANTTPILDDRHAQRRAAFERHEADVLRYNAVALEVMREAGVPVHDLHWVVEDGGPEQMLGRDGTHYTPEGYDRLAQAVADCVTRHLTIARYQPLREPAAGSDAATRYREDEAARDASTPAAYRDVRVGEFQVPESAEAWAAQRPGVLETVRRSLGHLPPRPSPVQAQMISREQRRGYTLEKVAIPNGVDGAVSALLLVPEGLRAPAPAILWLHSSTPHSTQIVTPHTNGGAESLGESFVRAGYVVLAPDAYWHGDRAGSGPAGSYETGRAEQESLFKFHLWLGRTLWGMFVRDDQVALDYLCSRPEVDTARIGATGMSMGSTRAWWLAAVDDRVAATVGVACLTRYQDLIRHGQLRQHGIYYFVNGLLQHFDSEGVLALLAPRPFLALTGELDGGSPADGIVILEDRVGRVYHTLGAPDRFRSVLYPNTGHTYTAEMRSEMLSWFERWLKPA